MDPQTFSEWSTRGGGDWLVAQDWAGPVSLPASLPAGVMEPRLTTKLTCVRGKCCIYMLKMHRCLPPDLHNRTTWLLIFAFSHTSLSVQGAGVATVRQEEQKLSADYCRCANVFQTQADSQLIRTTHFFTTCNKWQVTSCKNLRFLYSITCLINTDAHSWTITFLHESHVY